MANLTGILQRWITLLSGHYHQALLECSPWNSLNLYVDRSKCKFYHYGGRSVMKTWICSIINLSLQRYFLKCSQSIQMVYVPLGLEWKWLLCLLIALRVSFIQSSMSNQIWFKLKVHVFVLYLLHIQSNWLYRVWEILITIRNIITFVLIAKFLPQSPEVKIYWSWDL